MNIRNHGNMNKKDPIDSLLSNYQTGNRDTQREVYVLFYQYALSVCLRYSYSIKDAKKILNDSFFRFFTKLRPSHKGVSARKLLKEIIIDFVIKDVKKGGYVNKMGLKSFDDMSSLKQSQTINAFKMLCKLPPVNRIVFNLHVIDEYSCVEIAQRLNISINQVQLYVLETRQLLLSSLPLIQESCELVK